MRHLISGATFLDDPLAGLAQMRMRGIAIAGVTVATALATLGGAASATAGIDRELAVFGDCPLSNPNVGLCIYSTTTGGEFVLGSKTVPINKTIILQGGLAATNVLVPAADGNTLSRTPLTVPGGLTGIEGLGGEVTATAELAGPVLVNGTNLLGGFGTAVGLPLKVKLDHPVLGATCYIGSETEPINLELTTGTTSPPEPNKPISGNPGKITFPANGNIVLVTGSKLVNNSFAAPGANGCGLLPLVFDPLVDNSAGLPAAAGHNTAIMTGPQELAFASKLRLQAKLPEIGRCRRALTKETGAFEDAKCTGIAEGTGNYEFFEGPGPKRKFKTKGGTTTLQGAHGAGVKCSASTMAGEYTGAKSLTASLTLSGCKSAATRLPCQSAGAASGEIKTSTLAGILGFIQDKATTELEPLVSVGVDLSHGPSLLQAECTGISEELVVTGSVIGAIAKLDKMSLGNSLTYTASSGSQLPEEFEEGSKDTLTATLGSGAEQAGLTTAQSITNEEPLEIQAVQH
jgi:hypothetical protein